MGPSKRYRHCLKDPLLTTGQPAMNENKLGTHDLEGPVWDVNTCHEHCHCAVTQFEDLHLCLGFKQVIFLRTYLEKLLRPMSSSSQCSYFRRSHR